MNSAVRQAAFVSAREADHLADEWTEMRQGCYWRENTLFVPACFYCRRRTPLAANVWRSHGFEFDRTARVWSKCYGELSADRRGEIMERANAEFYRVWETRPLDAFEIAEIEWENSNWWRSIKSPRPRREDYLEGQNARQ